MSHWNPMDRLQICARTCSDSDQYIRQMGIRGTEEVERRTEGEYRRCWNLVSGLIFLCWTSVSCGTDPSERMFICLECVEDKQHVTVTMSLLIRSAVQQFSRVVSGLQPYRETDTKLVFFFFFSSVWSHWNVTLNLSTEDHSDYFMKIQKRLC